MTAFQKLILFSTKLDGELRTEYQQLISDYMDERERLQNERLATLQATTGTFDVVAIAGTAETLLNEINVGDTVECVRDSYPNTLFEFPPIFKGTTLKVDTRFSDKVSFENYYHSYNVSNFRKVQTPLSNPHQTVEGC